MERIGRYELSAKLGRGGMGVVYRAFDTLLQRTVAVKLIGAQIHDQPGMRERFFREARAAGQLSHKNIITVHDLGEENGQPFLAMEYLEGEDLQQRLNGPAKPSLTAKLDIAIQICEGLEYAHSRGVIHRDIKPANVFITNAGVVKILDFGLARLGASQLTNTGMVMGTINYMAPEQVRGEKADHRADIFSTGVLLYEMFSGQKAFDGESFAATLMKILQDAPAPLDQLDPNVPNELTHIVDRALAKRLDQRYQHMSELRADLQAVRRQFDSPTILAPMIGPGDTTTLAPTGIHERGLPSRQSVQVPPPSDTASGATGSGARSGGVPQPHGLSQPHAPSAPGLSQASDGQQPASTAPRSTAPTHPLDPSVRGVPGDGASGRTLKPWMLAAAAALVVALIGAAAWLNSDQPASPPAESTDVSTQPISQTAAISDAQTPAAQEKPADPPPAAPPPSTAAGGDRPDAAAPRTESKRNEPKPPVETKKPNTAAENPRPTGRADAGAKPSASEPAKPAAPKPAEPEPPPTIPVSSGTPNVLPTSPVVTPPPTSTAPPPAAPPPAPAAAPEKKGPTPEEGMNELVERYRAALEARDLNALRRVWPGLSGRMADGIRADFENASSIQVDISNRVFKPSGSTGVITFVRRYVPTFGGQRRAVVTTATMTVRLTPAGWVIENMQFSQPR